MSQSRRLRRANGMKGSTVRKALESGTPLNSLYALIPDNRRNALEQFLRLIGKKPAELQQALAKEKQSPNRILG